MTRANFLKTLTGLLASPFIPAAPVSTLSGVPSSSGLLKAICDFVKVKPEVTFGGMDTWFFFSRKETKDNDGMVTGHTGICSAKVGDISSFLNVVHNPEFDGFILPSSESLATRVGSPKEIEKCITQLPYLRSIEKALKNYCYAWIEYAANHEISPEEAREFAADANFIKFNGRRLNFSKMITEWEERTGLQATPSHCLLHLHLKRSNSEMLWMNVSTLRVVGYEVSCIKQ